MRERARRLVSRSGLSTVELSVTVALLGMALSLGMQRIDSTSWKLDAASRDVAQRARTARALAVLKQHNMVLSIDMGETAVVLHEDENNDGIVNGDERVTRYHLDKGIYFTRGTAPAFEGYTEDAYSFDSGVLTFRRNGSASEEGVLYIARRNGKRARAVVVSRATGYTEIKRNNGAGWQVNE